MRGKNSRAQGCCGDVPGARVACLHQHAAPKCSSTLTGRRLLNALALHGSSSLEGYAPKDERVEAAAQCVHVSGAAPAQT